ncbi:hypothetical protein ACFYMW_09770 [Streptomyces sp. NPDC006692]|uniref:hypothetical protein n=1 Tax=unclassified Streptomyces TaxID=2593676 RepID=UPI0036A6BF3E
MSSTMWNHLVSAGDIGMTLLTTWIAKVKLRDLLAGARLADPPTRPPALDVPHSVR